jgi:uncharacterized protein RhaS with RHS repeats
MYDPKAARWLSQDPIGFDAGDPNLYRYVGNEPTNETDRSGLEASATDPAALFNPSSGCSVLPTTEDKIATVTKVYLVDNKKDIPKFAKDVKFDPIQEEGQLGDVGPWNDPNKKGNFHHTLWIVFEGDNLEDLEFSRFWAYTWTLGKAKPTELGGGFRKEDELISEKDADGPRPHEIKQGDKWALVADSPGVNNAAAGDYPVDLKINYLVVAKSKTDKKIKAEIWYDVLINAEAPGKAKTNKADVRRRVPG